MGFMMSHHEEKMGQSQTFYRYVQPTWSNLHNFKPFCCVQQISSNVHNLKRFHYVQQTSSNVHGLKSFSYVQQTSLNIHSLKRFRYVQQTSSQGVYPSVSKQASVDSRRRTVDVAFHREFVYCFPKFYIRMNVVDNSFQKRR